MNRGAGRNQVLSTRVDAESFLDCMADAASRYEVEIHAYCLMGNHFHLLVRSRSGRLSEFVRFAVGRFSRTKNKRDRSDGPLFRSRFTSKPVESDPQLLECSRYIYLNPVRAGSVTAPENWPWSSAGAYLSKGRAPN